MKKFFAVLLAAAMTMSLVACGSDEVVDAVEEVEAVAEEAGATEEEVAAVEETAAEAAEEVEAVVEGWGSDELTAMLPQPKFEVLESEVAGDVFAAIVDADIEQLKEYAVALQDAGFSNDLEGEADGAYAFSGKNAEGYTIYVARYEEQSAIMFGMDLSQYIGE